MEGASAREDNTTYSGQKRAAPTLALVKALRMAHDEAHDPVLGPTPGKELEERSRGKTRRGESRDRGDRHRGAVDPGVAAVKLGMEAKVMRVATTITASEAAAVVEAEEAYRVFVVAQDAAKGEIMVATIVRRSQLWGRQRRAEERRERTFIVGRLVNFFPLVFGLEHGPREGDRGSGQQASDPFHLGGIASHVLKRLASPRPPA